MPILRTALIVHGGEPVNAIVLPADPSDAADYCANYNGVCVLYDQSDEYGVDTVTLTGCIAVEVTGLDPMPGLGTGWTYVDETWVEPTQEVEGFQPDSV